MATHVELEGYSLVELLFALGVATTLTAAAVPPVLAALDDYRTLGAVRYLATRLQRTRMEAVSRHADAALQFEAEDRTYRYAVYLDGNGNGVRRAEVDRGIDRQIHAPERLSDRFRAVDFGALPGLPAVDPPGPAPGTDPVRLGTTDSVTFTPLGTATPGSLYVLGAGRLQYVIRVFGETGKTRILRFNQRTRQWEAR
jgi:hypothetical protein